MSLQPGASRPVAFPLGLAATCTSKSGSCTSTPSVLQLPRMTLDQEMVEHSTLCKLFAGGTYTALPVFHIGTGV